MMTPEITGALVAGLFGLVPLMVQIVSTRAQRRDRMSRLNQLRAELELLERIHTLQGEVSATDEATKPQTDLVISDSLRKLFEQYNELSEITPSAVVGGKQPAPRRLSFLRRAFLLYYPHTTSGWILHTLFYMIAIIYVMWFLLAVISAILLEDPSGRVNDLVDALLGFAFLAVLFGIPLLIIQRLATRNAARSAAQLEEPNA
jgi:hypothetical protein